jgi:hypothetical protein
MNHAEVKSSTIAAAGRWDAKYHIRLKDWLNERGLDETEENVLQAMEAIRAHDTGRKELAVQKRLQASDLVNEARQLKAEAELTFPIRMR